MRCVTERAAGRMEGPSRPHRSGAAGSRAEPPPGSRHGRRGRVFASRVARAWLRPAIGGAILAGVAWRLGAGPFIDGLRVIRPGPVAAAVVIAVVTTVCAAWRWSLVARGLGVQTPLRSAVASCYRSQFLNSTLPGGVLGDVHRGVRHGHDAGDVGRSLRAVAWERSAGQAVQVVLAVIVVAVFPSPVRWALPYALIGILVIGALVGLLRRALPVIRNDLRDGLLARSIWPGVLVASAVAVIGHGATFLIAARAAGSTAPIGQLLPLAAVTLVAMGLPINVGGWGPREGVCGAVFGAAGLGASLGVTVAVVYGVIALAACLPGAVVLLAGARRRSRPATTGTPVMTKPEPVRVEAAAHG